jgi:Domain of unknown function (DUF4430)
MMRPSCFLVALLLAGCNSQYIPIPAPAVPATATTTPTGTSGVVTVEFQINGETKTVKVADVAEGATVEAVMQSIEGIPIELHGSGVTAFIHSIAGKSTSGTEGWTYKVNGQFANEGIGSTTLTPPATITWEFGESPSQ